jgi:hypothetical protein
MGVLFCCIFTPHSCNLKAVQDLLKQYKYKPPTNSPSKSIMRLENRRHTRARVKWPASINAPTGLVDGTQVVWSYERTLSDQRRFLGIGVRFTRMMLHDREFLHGEIVNHT